MFGNVKKVAPSCPHAFSTIFDKIQVDICNLRQKTVYYTQMKKWIAIAVIVLIVATSVTVGILVPKDDSSFIFDIPSITIEVNTSKEIEYDFEGDASVSFSVENEDIAILSNNRIIAKSIGKTYLNAEIKFNNKLYYRSTLITVTDEEVRLRFDLPTTFSMNIGDTLSVFPTILTGLSKCNLSFSTSNSDIVEVNSVGILTAKSCGNADVYVLNNNQIVKTFHVNVTYDFSIIVNGEGELTSKNTITLSGDVTFKITFLDSNETQVVVDDTCQITTNSGISCVKLLDKFLLSATESGKFFIDFPNINVNIEINVIVT